MPGPTFPKNNHWPNRRIPEVLSMPATIGKVVTRPEFIFEDEAKERCDCRTTARTMGTMVRDGREGHGHYAHDGSYLGPCEKPIVWRGMTQDELNKWRLDCERMLSVIGGNINHELGWPQQGEFDDRMRELEEQFEKVKATWKQPAYTWTWKVIE